MLRHPHLFDNFMEPAPIESDIPERRKLWQAYLNSFPDRILVADVCWAAKQHRSQWFRWVSGQLKDGSEADLAFRAVLTSGKRPEEYRKVFRRPGWR